MKTITIGQALVATVFAAVLVLVATNIHTTFVPTHDSQKANCVKQFDNLSDVFCVER